MVNKIRAQQVVDHKIKSYTIDNYIMWFEKKEDDLNADYQRDYVWSEKEQQAFLCHLISGLPVGHISFVENEKQMYEVVDGKQRLTTLKLFVSNQIPIVLNGEVYHYSDLDVGEQRAFRNLMLPAIELLDNSEKAKIKYFIDINFSGVPQSKEHEEKVLKMYEALS